MNRAQPQRQEAVAAAARLSVCEHCRQPVPEASAGGPRFCCQGCAAAHALIGELGLERYYARRVLDPGLRPPKPEPDEVEVDLAAHVRTDKDGVAVLHLMVDGLHCAACVWLIEHALAREPGVLWARVNMSTRRLTLRWRTGEADPEALVRRVQALGFRLAPFDPERLGSAASDEQRALLRAMAVAGFAAGNIMLLSIAVWAGLTQDMGPATRGLMHWISALIAVPAVGYAARPFLRSAAAGLAAGRVNMDVPISLAVLLTLGMSLFETWRGGVHVYFDSATALLFFLLIGRYLDSRARGRARAAAAHLLALGARAVTVLEADGRRRRLPPAEVPPGATVLVAAGERIGVDGRVLDGDSDVDMSLINGESVPAATGRAERVFAGTLNLTAPLKLMATAVAEDTVLAEIVRLMETAEQGRARYVALADRLARLYAPAVHGLALATFLGWWLAAGAAWQTALLYAVAVLVITCPCALALAVPAVQVVAGGRLLKDGVLLKSATALERLAACDAIVFDKTGTLTEGRPRLEPNTEAGAEDLRLAASMAAASRHPLARALCREAPLVAVASGVREAPGRGLALDASEGEVRLGSRAWCGVAQEDAEAGGAPGLELWLTRPGRPAVRFAFADPLRRDAADTVARLREEGYALELLSGDRQANVADAARALGLAHWRAGCTPEAKVARLGELAAQGRKVLMVGDGLNDAPALAAALVSLSPANAADLSQTAADAIFQGRRLAPVAKALDVALRARRLVRQNLALAFVYNAVTVPLAVAGLVTPLIAALAMSASSLVVVGNALRLGAATGTKERSATGTKERSATGTKERAR